MKTSYKLQKEAFISGHTGQSVKEIAMIIGVIMSMHFLSAAFQSRRSNETYRFYYFLIEYGIYYMVPLFFVTFFASHLMLLILLLSFSTLILLFCTKPQKTDRDVGNKPLDFFERSLKCVHDAKNSDLKSYVTIFRGTIMLITCVAILAVDFRIFPRRFSKVETWGISLMDLGVGFFVFSSGIVAIKNIKKNYSDRNTSFMKKMMISLKQSYMFFVIGFIRIFITKMANYPEHVTEYGVHWNFFFTLGFLSLSLVFIEFLRHYLKSYIIIIALLSVYNELLIGSSRIVTYVLDAPRTNLISANKEGIFSLSGYLIIYLVGINIGEYLFYGDFLLKKNKSIITNNHYKIIFRIFSLTILYFLVYCYFVFYGKYPMSRRLANLPYVYLISACSCYSIACDMFIEILFFGPSAKYTDTVPLLLYYINKNGLIVFLVANVITGLINLSIDTLQVNNITSFFIMIIYGIILCGIAFIIDFKKWKF